MRSMKRNQTKKHYEDWHSMILFQSRRFSFCTLMFLKFASFYISPVLLLPWLRYGMRVQGNHKIWHDFSWLDFELEGAVAAVVDLVYEQ